MNSTEVMASINSAMQESGYVDERDSIFIGTWSGSIIKHRMHFAIKRILQTADPALTYRYSFGNEQIDAFCLACVRKYCPPVMASFRYTEDCPTPAIFTGVEKNTNYDLWFVDIARCSPIELAGVLRSEITETLLPKVQWIVDYLALFRALTENPTDIAWHRINKVMWVAMIAGAGRMASVDEDKVLKWAESAGKGTNWKRPPVGMRGLSDSDIVSGIMAEAAKLA